jgi:hypothetical protein
MPKKWTNGRIISYLAHCLKKRPNGNPVFFFLSARLGLSAQKKLFPKKVEGKDGVCARAALCYHFHRCQSHPRFTFEHVYFLFLPWPEKKKEVKSKYLFFEIEMKNAASHIVVFTLVLGCDDEMKTSTVQ